MWRASTFKRHMVHHTAHFYLFIYYFLCPVKRVIQFNNFSQLDAHSWLPWYRQTSQMLLSLSHFHSACVIALQTLLETIRRWRWPKAPASQTCTESNAFLKRGAFVVCMNEWGVTGNRFRPAQVPKPPIPEPKLILQPRALSVVRNPSQPCAILQSLGSLPVEDPAQ